METSDLLSIFNVSDLRKLPEAIMDLITGDTLQRDSVYKQLLKLNNYDLSFDWFQLVYEREFAQRKEKKQDFTPLSVGQIASMICGEGQRTTYEPTAGNGSMLISDWYNKLSKCYPWEFLPSKNMFECWELSDRSIPILLLNLSIRGMMGVVYHGDILEQDVIQKYILLNRHDDALGFSDVCIVSNDSKIVRL